MCGGKGWGGGGESVCVVEGGGGSVCGGGGESVCVGAFVKMN